jgi:serine/threonine-protein kinase Chk1
MEYLHSKGVAHRDLKPENILLDTEDKLKISDFGLATVFKHEGKERKLETCCGTVPYVAPEVLQKKLYSAQPMDIWSCGIILVALLAGELPWDEPSYGCQEYLNWKDCKITLSPWCKIDTLALSILRKILVENPTKRATVEVVKNHQWFNKNFHKELKRSSSGGPSDSPFGSGTPFKRLNTGTGHCASLPREDVKMPSTQPDLGTTTGNDVDTNTGKSMMSFTQPALTEHILLDSQVLGTPGASQSMSQRLVRRMTRFFVKTNAEQTMTQLIASLDKHGYGVKKNSADHLTVSTFDRRRRPLTFKANLYEMGEDILVDFRLSKGDGLEFKRHFLEIRRRLVNIINKKVPVLGPM